MLLTVMVVVSIITMLLMALMEINAIRLSRSRRYGAMVQARWLAEGEVENFLTRVEAGLEMLEEKEYEIDSELGPIEVTVRPGNYEREYVVTATAVCRQVESTVQRGIMAFYASDYAITVDGDWQILSRSVPSILVGRVYTSGSLALAVAEKGDLTLVADRADPGPMLTVCGGLGVESLDGKGNLIVLRAECDPYNLAEAWDEDSARGFYPVEDGETQYERGSSREIFEAPPRQKVKFPDFDVLYQQLLKRSDRTFQFLGNDTGRFETVKIYNPKLMTKDLLAVGNGQKHMFRYKPKDRTINQIYMRRVREGQRVDEIFIDPIADADSIGNKFFTARMGLLHLPGPNTRLYLQMKEYAYREMGRIYYGTMHRSYCSVDNPLHSFMVKTPGSSIKYEEGSDFQVNTIRKYLEFSSQEFFQEHFVILNEQGDGRRLGFSLPEGQNFKFVYVRGQRTDNYTKEAGKLFFAAPPPDGAEIALMTKIPRIFARKEPPPAGVGIFADREVPVLKIDLSELRHYPDEGLIITDRPVLVTGEASYPVTVVSSADIYMNNINRAARDPEPVGIMSGRIVWIDNSSGKTNVNKRVYVHTRADRIYTTGGRKPRNKYDKATMKSTGFVIGSVHISGEVANAYYNYPQSMRNPDVALFSDEPFATVQYRYDPAFADPENLPPGVSPQLKLLWWKR